MLRKILSLTLTIALLATFCAFPVSAASPSIGVHTVNAFSGTVKATNFVANSNVKIVGRNNPANPLVFAWHASGVEFDVTGTEVVGVRLKDYVNYNSSTTVPLVVTINGEHITLDGSDNTEIYDYNDDNQTWLTNNPQPDKNCFEVPDDGAQHDYIFATNLDPDKTYTVKVTMDIENWAEYQYYAFNAVSALTDNSTSAVVSKTADADNKILVLGDSITSARNIGGIHNSYHQLTAAAFGADTQVLSAGGGLFTRKYLHDTNTDDSSLTYAVDPTNTIMSNKFSVVDAWDKTAWYKYEYVPELWDANDDGVIDTYATKSNPRFTPDLIILNIGTNDGRYLRDTNTIPSEYSSNGAYATVGDYNKNVFKTDLYTFLDNARDIYNNPKIILCYGMMSRYTDIMSFYDSIVNEYNTANSGAKVSTYFFDEFDVSKAGKLDDTHPDKYAHTTASELLISEVKSVMGWERVTDDPLTARVPQTITLVPNSTGDKFTLPSKYDKVIVGDTIVIPYGGGKGLATPETSLLTINGVKYSLQPLWKDSLYLYGTIGGTTYTATASGCYVSGQGSVNGTAVAPKVAHTNATTGWASGLVFEITETGTYYASNKWFQAYDSETGTYWVDTQLSRTEIMEPFTPVEVVTITFVDRSIGTVNHDRQINTDKGSTVTVPKKYATGYKFYSNAACTTEIDLATATFNSDSTVYVLDINDVSDTPVIPQPTATTYFYPEYPEYTDDGEIILPRDYDYEVYVNDGAKDTQIPVYDATRTRSTYVARGNKGDSHRRFSEFSFDGEVTVKIKVKGKMSNYAVLPSNEIPSSSTSYDASTGTISIKLTEPKDFVVRLNDDWDSIISIFAEDLWTEAEVPAGAIVYEAGYHDVAKNNAGQLVVNQNETVYLYPGAIVNARVKVASWDHGNNTTVCGRGAFIDPRTSSENDPKSVNGDGVGAYMFTVSLSNDVTLKGVKFLDAHCFNIGISQSKNFLVDGIKVLSSEISTDGFYLYGDTTYGTVQNSFFYVNDNVFVLAGSSSSNGGVNFKNNIVGTGYAVFYPQDTINQLTFDGLDIFRMNQLFKGSTQSSEDDIYNFTVKNVRAEDSNVSDTGASSGRELIYIENQDTATKTITLQNVALPAGMNVIYSKTGMGTGFNFTFKDVFIGGTRVTSTSQLTRKSSGSEVTVNISNANTSLNSFGAGKFSLSKKTASHTADPTIIIGDGFVTDYYKVNFDVREDSTVYVPVAYILKNAGYDVKVENNGAKVTATDDNTTVVLTETSASNTTLTDKPELVDGILMAPTSLMYEVYGLKVGLNAQGNLLVSANGYDNLLKDPGFESLVETSNFNNTYKFATSYNWSHFRHGKYYYDSTNKHSGNYGVKVIGAKSSSDYAFEGIAQHIGDTIKTYGAGTYTFTAYVKLDSSTCDSNFSLRFGLAQADWNAALSGNQYTDLTYSNFTSGQWKQVSKTITITESDLAKADVLLVYITAEQTGTAPIFYVDDACLTFTPTETSTQTPDIVPYIASADRTIYYEYNGSSAVINTAKTPSNITVKIGDRLDIRDVLMQKYPNIDLNRVTLKTTYTSGTWYQEPAVEEIYAAETGTLTISISQYFDMSGTKKTVSDTLLTVTVASATAPSNLSTYSYSLLNDTNAIIHGRVADTALNQFYWQGSGAEFKFTGTTVGLKVTTKSTQKIIYQIDGGKEQTLVVAGVNASNVGYTYILAENLENKEHTVKFLRSYESFWGAATISAVTPLGKYPSKPTSSSELKIQFIGDSITSGNSLESYTQSYAYLASKELNADFQAFSISGATISDFKVDDGTRKSVNGAAVMPYLYGDKVSYSQTKTKVYQFDESTYTGTLVSGTSSKNVYYPSSTTYDMTRFTPDVVVINLGTNDTTGLQNTYASYNKEVFANMYANFLIKLGEYYPDAKFVLSYGMMWKQQAVVDAIEDVLTLYRQKGGTNPAKTLMFTTSSDKAYDNSHPGVKGHATAAAELVKAINDGFEEVTGTVFTADANGNITLPEEVVIPEGHIFLGWYDENGNAFVEGTKVTANSQITLEAKTIDATEALTGKVNPDGICAEPFSGDSAIGSDAEFTNGIYYQGIQIRKTSPTGLRFVFARGFALERLINNEIANANFEVRYLVALKSKLQGEELTVDTASLDRTVENIYRTSEELSAEGKEAEDYNKFTVCITGLDVGEYLDTVICVRPYITYTDASGIQHILYGEQASCSLYEAAKGIYDASTNEADKQWLYENILVLNFGDNDEDAGNIFQ